MTNLVLNILVLVVLIGVCAPVLRTLRTWPVVSTALLLAILTLIFDSLMIGADLYVYHPDKITGLYLWDAPIEDLAYPIAAAVAMPTLWTALERRRARRGGDRGAAGPDGGAGDAGTVTPG